MRTAAHRALPVCCALLLCLLLPVFSAAEETDVLAGSLPYLANKDFPVDESFVPADLVLLTDVLDPSLVKVKYKDTQAVRTAAEALAAMLEAAGADGVRNWQVSAAYRSFDQQQRLLDNKIRYYRNKNPSWSRSRARSAALRSVAEPGCSEHHLGLAFDVNVPSTSAFKGTKQCKWLHEHCWEYGFIVRYQAGKEAITGYTAEEWHIRYVGTEHSLYIRDHGLCLEEYLLEASEGLLVVEDLDELPLEWEPDED